MRHHPSCWNKVLAKLGFRRVPRPKHRTALGGRLSRFESLEARQLLAAHTYVVTTLEDVAIAGQGVVGADNQWSLREALTHSAADAQPGEDIIQFAELTGTIELSLGQLTVSRHVKIAGTGSDKLTIDANDASRIFLINAGAQMTISGLTLTGGHVTGTNFGGAIDNYGFVTIESAVVTDNDAWRGGAIYNRPNGKLHVIDSELTMNSAVNIGGAILSDSMVDNALVIERSAIINNQASGAGAIYLDGNDGELGTAIIRNSTISGNRALTGSGGAIANGGGAPPLTIVNSTIAYNTAVSSGGISMHNNGANRYTLHNTILAHNDATNATTDNLNRAVNSSSSYNVIGYGGSSGLSGNGNVLLGSGVSAGLLPLGEYGGPTKTHALTVNSPAVHAGSFFVGQTVGFMDQRGRKRDSLPDIGAYESTVLVSTPLDGAEGNFSYGNLSLREAISIALSGSQIEFDPSLAGQTISLLANLGQLTVNKSVEIIGLGADQLTVTANGNHRVFQVLTGVTTAISGLTITGGKANGVSGFEGYGGGIFSQGDLTLDFVEIVGNEASQYGGGVFTRDTGSLTVVNSTFDDNEAGMGGGALSANHKNGLALSINGSTFSNNRAIGAGGGAIWHNSGTGGTSTFEIKNSTFSGNTAPGGGAIFFQTNPGTTVAGSIVNSTIAYNQATTSVGGGIRNLNGASITLHNTILAGNTSSNAQYPDVWGNVAGTVSAPSSNNILGVQHSAIAYGTQAHSGLINTTHANQVGNQTANVNPGLMPLGDYGGPTKTHALLPNSQAINAGGNAAAAGLAVDQRGARYLRTLGDTVDIGAVEATVTQATPTGAIVIYGTEGPDAIYVGKNAAGVEFVSIDTAGGVEIPIALSSASSVSIYAGGGDDTVSIDHRITRGVAIYGGEGNDTLVGGSGQDYLVGGPGQDVFPNIPDNDLSPPEFEPLGTIEVRKDRIHRVRLVASDADSFIGSGWWDSDWTYEYFIAPGETEIPESLGPIDKDGVLNWNGPAGNNEGPGTYRVGVRITDPDGLTDEQIVTIREYDYNETAPSFSSYFVWYDEQEEPDPQTDTPRAWGHSHIPNTGSTGIHADLISITLAETPGATLTYPSSTTLHIKINPHIDGAAFEFDTQTSNQNIVYSLLSGPGSVTAGGDYVLPVDLGDAGQTYRVVFLATDTGSPDNGEVRAHHEYLYVRVIGIFDVSSEYEISVVEAPVAIDRAYGMTAAESYIEGSIASGYDAIGAYAPIFNEFPVFSPYEHLSKGATFTLGSPAHGTVELLDSGEPLSRGHFRYTPEPGFRGFDSFTYTITHYLDFDLPDTVTSNTGVVYLYVGPVIENNTDTYVLDSQEDEDSAWISWNNDDDNRNEIPDYLELTSVAGENDLLELKLDPYLREDQYEEIYYLQFLYGTNGLRIWTSPDKQEEILFADWLHYEDLPESVWLEAVQENVTGRYGSSIHSTYSANPPVLDVPPTGAIETDFNLLQDYAVDLDIDSDNNNAFTAPTGSDWEEFLEDHAYGLGKLIMLDNPTRPVTPIVLKLPLGLDSSDPSVRIRIDWEITTSAGGLKLWNTPVVDEARNENAIEGGGDRLVPGSLYQLSDLNYDTDLGWVVFFAEGYWENPVIKTLAGVEQNGKPDERVRATVVVNGVDAGSDEVKYIVANEDSFFYHLQNRREVRTGLASKSIYTRGDKPQLSLELLSNSELAKLEVPVETRNLLGNANGIAGFNAGLYQDFTQGPNTFIVAFAGTDDFNDILTDLWQGLGLFDPQFAAAITIGESLAQIQVIANGLVTTGHSLGGGLAAAASIAGGITGDTFNAAGLHSNTLAMINNPNSPLVDAFYIDWDLLSLVQDVTYGIAPSAYGNRHELDGPYDLEVFGAGAVLIIGAYTGLTWVGLAGLLGDVGSAGLSHRMDVVLYGLLVNEDTGADMLGYEYGVE